MYRIFLNKGKRLQCIAALTGDLEVIHFFNMRCQQFPCRRFVIYYQALYFHFKLFFNFQYRQERLAFAHTLEFMPVGVNDLQSLFHIFHTDAFVHSMPVHLLGHATILNFHRKPIIFYRNIDPYPAIAHIIANAMFEAVLKPGAISISGGMVNCSTASKQFTATIQPLAIPYFLQFYIIMYVFHFLAHRYKLLAAIVQHITKQ